MVVNKVSVIVPIFKVENFIQRCVCSLMEQTLQEVEYIFVDDASPDRSMEILTKCLLKYPNRIDSVKILHHDVNKGLPAARNTGLVEASGEYIFHCDSDDFVDSTMLEMMYTMGKNRNADYIWSDWYLSYQHTDRYMKQPDFMNPENALKGMLSDAMKYNVWNKLVKRDLYEENHILFPEGHSMGEDMTMIRLMACAKSVAYVPKAFYHYIKTNASAMTQTLKKEHLNDIRYNVEMTIKFLHQKGIVDLQKEESFFKLNVKLPFLISTDWKNYKKWSEWYPEANSFIMDNRQIPLRTRILQWMADKDIYLGIWLYNLVCYKLLYRIIYQR